MASSRSRPSVTAARQSRVHTALPAYQAPQHPLNENAQRALQNLPRDHKLDTLKQRLRVANNHLTHAAADVNDRYQVKYAENDKRKRRLEKQASQEGNEAQDALLDAMREKTDEMTDRLEEGIRKIIDAGAEVDGMEKALRELQENVANGGGRVAPTQSTLGASYNRSARRRQSPRSGDENSELEEEDSQMVGENDSAMGVLKRKIGEQRAAYQNLSMSSRYVFKKKPNLQFLLLILTSYASHNDYVGFKKIVHDAHYPEQEAPPMPHASTWFPSESPDPSNPNTCAAAARDAIQDDDDDLAVASERVSINCPLTLRPMKDPVTSQKCPHSFEKEAILDMISRSDVIIGGSGRRGVHDGQKAMKCPVCEVVRLIPKKSTYTANIYQSHSSSPPTTSKKTPSSSVRSNASRLLLRTTNSQTKMMMGKAMQLSTEVAGDQKKSVALQHPLGRRDSRASDEVRRLVVQKGRCLWYRVHSSDGIGTKIEKSRVALRSLILRTITMTKTCRVGPIC